MSENAIVVENLSKRYLIGHRLSASGGRFKYTALRDIIGREISNFTRKAADVVRGRQVVQGDEIEEFWALKNVSFEVKQGEVLGIVGRNGAGKSTLLKILSRITEPTEGRISLRGRVSSLLEVGTGFHPELTGRENIFLNGAILGMTQREIRRKFDEIVAFAGVDKFLDTPVKHYSSGMYVRLAFAVAAHLDSDIMIVDEVLAVGDHEFRQKCLAKMNNIASHQGRTVLLVSHDLAAVSEMAIRALLVEGGRVAADGNVADIVSRYLSRDADAIYVRPPGQKSSTPFINRIEVCTSESNAVHRFGEPLEVKIWIQHDAPIEKGCLTLNVHNQHQHAIFDALAHYPYFRFGNSQNKTLLICKLPSPKLYVGKYYLSVHLSEPPGGDLYESLDGVCMFEVTRTDRTSLFPRLSGECAYFEEYYWETADADTTEHYVTHVASHSTLQDVD
jgi:ABC-type polysaccharide/polyol phosphate transport system ATPase subunit